MNRLNIAFVITRADAVGGATVHVRDLAAALIAAGHRATVLVGGEGAVTRQLEGAGIPFVSLRRLRRSVNPVHDLLAVRELAAAIREMGRIWFRRTRRRQGAWRGWRARRQACR